MIGRIWDRVIQYPKWACILLGAGVALGHAPLSLWPISLLCLIAFLALARHSVTPFRYGWIFGFGYFGITLNWIVEPFLVDIQTTGFMAPFALVLMSGGLAVFWGVAGSVARILGPIGWVVGLSLAEFLRGILFTGFPWGLLSYTQAENPFVGIFAWVGPHGATLFLLVICYLCARRSWKLAALVCAIVGTCTWIPLPEIQGDIPNTTVRLVQPNAPQEQKWDPLYAPLFFDRMIDATRADPPVDLIVWPESALAPALNYASAEIAEIRSAAGNADIIFGILRLDARDQLFNTLALSREKQELQIYDKARLVPFGEYLPFEDWLLRNGFGFAPELFGVGFSAGTGAKRLILSSGLKVLPLICYEIIFPRAVAQGRKEADLIVQISNDAWFGTFSGPAQHLEITRLRAIEQGITILRVSNPGISAVIDGRGQMVAQMPLNTTGFLDVIVPLSQYITPYARFGDWIYWILFVAVLFGTLWRCVIKD